MLPRNSQRKPTDEQKAILESPARIRVVRACPGAGKTEVFVEAIRRRLVAWDAPHAGLAALSFTNVARNAIEERSGGSISHPHFVGTLDSFVFRFVVKPFAHLLGLPLRDVRLFPAEICDGLTDPSRAVADDQKIRASIYNVFFGTDPNGNSQIQAHVGYENNRPIPEHLEEDILKWKHRFWKSSGIVTHSDAHFLAAILLNHPTFGSNIRRLLARRFPVIFLDEVQDTNLYLSAVFLSLFADPNVSGLVVGDTNQAIFVFGGANPRIFDHFEALPGAVRFPMTLSQRCPKFIAQLVSALGDSSAPVKSAVESTDGTATLVVHSLKDAALNMSQSQTLRGLLHGDSFAVITRNRQTASSLRGQTIQNEFAGTSSSAKRINQALQHFLAGDSRAATAIIEKMHASSVGLRRRAEAHGRSSGYRNRPKRMARGNRSDSSSLCQDGEGRDLE